MLARIAPKQISACRRRRPRLTRAAIRLKVGLQIGPRLDPLVVLLQLGHFRVVPRLLVVLRIELRDRGIQSVKEGEIGVSETGSSCDGILRPNSF